MPKLDHCGCLLVAGSDDMRNTCPHHAEVDMMLDRAQAGWRAAQDRLRECESKLHDSQFAESGANQLVAVLEQRLKESEGRLEGALKALGEMSDALLKNEALNDEISWRRSEEAKNVDLQARLDELQKVYDECYQCSVEETVRANEAESRLDSALALIRRACGAFAGLEGTLGEKAGKWIEDAADFVSDRAVEKRSNNS